jgi:membrane-associated phospholipid phosphatase
MASAKNHYNFWRPVTAIQAGGNKDWTPLVPTPPDQDYPSGHSIEGGAGAGVLKVFFGDQTTFKDCSITTPAGTRCGEPGQILRTYTSFSQAAEENAYSRVLVGFHFRNATKEGMAYGYKIAEQAVTLLPPVR